MVNHFCEARGTWPALWPLLTPPVARAILSLHHNWPAICFSSADIAHCPTFQIIQIGFGTRQFLNLTERDFPTLNKLLTKMVPIRTDMTITSFSKKELHIGIILTYFTIYPIEFVEGLKLMVWIMPKSCTHLKVCPNTMRLQVSKSRHMSIKSTKLVSNTLRNLRNIYMKKRNKLYRKFLLWSRKN